MIFTIPFVIEEKQLGFEQVSGYHVVYFYKIKEFC